jgi:hypothetical protein
MFGSAPLNWVLSTIHSLKVSTVTSSGSWWRKQTAERYGQRRNRQSRRGFNPGFIFSARALKRGLSAAWCRAPCFRRR